MPNRVADTPDRHPKLLLFYDWPPSSAWGGLVLLVRLLTDYPKEKISALVGTYAAKTDSLEGRLDCDYHYFPTMRPRGLWGLGWLIVVGDHLLLPLLVLRGLWTVRQTRPEVIVTVAHGHFFLAASVVSRLSGIPLILLLHDDWLARMQHKWPRLKKLISAAFRMAVRQASHIYAVSGGMQEMLLRDWGVESEIQLPATEHFGHTESFSSSPRAAKPLRILYSGWCGAPVLDGLNSLINLIKGDSLQKLGITEYVLDLYIPYTAEWLKRAGWEHERVELHGWVPQVRLREALAQADVLFLPFSFNEDWKFITTRAFPSKTADYLAAGKPILVRAPAYSTIAQYCIELGFAELVTSPDEGALAKSIAKLYESDHYREELCAKARVVFDRNHNIAKQRSRFLQLTESLSQRSASRVETMNGNGDRSR